MKEVIIISERGNRYLGLAIDLKKLWNMTVILIVFSALGTIPKELVKELKILEISGCGNYPDYSMIKIGQKKRVLVI